MEQQARRYPTPNFKTLPLAAWPPTLRAAWGAILDGRWSDAHRRRLCHASRETTREYQDQARATIARRCFKALTSETIEKLRRDLAASSAPETG